MKWKSDPSAGGAEHRADDLAHFIRILEHLSGAPQDLFSPAEPVWVARAPGRLDVMGGIADYSGSLVLEMPIAEATFAAVQQRSDRLVSVASVDWEDPSRMRQVEMELEQVAAASNYAVLHASLGTDPDRSWAGYVMGTLLALIIEADLSVTRGLTMVVSSRVPEGKGVSSSAALEVASMQALVRAFDLNIDPAAIATWCQRVENLVVGAPCGIMDQMTSALGRSGQLLQLLCQPATVLKPAVVPPEIAFWGIDSGLRHAVSGSDYTSVRVGAFMGYRIVAELAGFRVRFDDGRGVVQVDDPRYGGYLANLSPSEFAQHYATHLPRQILGKDFLTAYSGTTDSVTKVEPDRTYAVLEPTQHPIGEHFRVRVFAELLPHAGSERARELLGELMYQSHASYSACGLGSDGTDLLVELVRRAGPRAGLYGAKITGGGSGGTVAVLGAAGAGGAVARIAEQYAEQTGRHAAIFSGSSEGAAAFGATALVTE